MITHLRREDLAEILTLARKRAGLVAPTGRVVRPLTTDEMLWWQRTARIRARIASLPLEAQHELLAMAWLGRDGDLGRWEALLSTAADIAELGTYIAAKAALHIYLAEAQLLITDAARWPCAHGSPAQGR